jgi:4-hydroxybenzoate polyprenyltransferase
MQATLRPVSREAEAVAPGKLPLVVDMDGFLVRADLETEAQIATLEACVRRIAGAIRGQHEAIDGAEIAELARRGPDVDSLPLDRVLVDYLIACHETGREIHLVTAATQEIADAIAARVGVFASALGARSGTRLDEEQKRALVRRRFPEGFAYAGRTPGLIAEARSAVLVKGDGVVVGRIHDRGGAVEAELEGRRAGLRTWIAALRCHQWSKNALVFVPLVLAHAYGELAIGVRCALGFLLLSLLASGTYLVNDILDLEADRRHPTKCNRPLARGDIAAGSAAALAGVLILASLAAAYALSWPFFLTLSAYLVTTLAYSLWLKRQMLVDVFVLACLFTSRIAMGIALAAVAPSSWLLTFTMFFFLSLSLAKRHVEVVGAADRGIAEIPGRDYRASDLPLTVALGVGCNAVAMLVLFLYLTHDAMPTGAYRQPYWLWGAAFVVFLWSLRIWGLSHRGRLDADPVAFAIRDPVSITLGLVVAGVLALAV